MKKLLILLSLVTCVICASAQSSVRTVVLINGEPYLAEVSTNGDILQRYQKVDNYFSTKESHGSIVSRLSKQAQPTGEPIVLFEKEAEPVPSYTEENKAPILTGESQYIGFSPDKAILTKSAVDHVDSYRSRSLARNRARGIKELLGAFGTTRNKVNFEIRDASFGTKVDFVQVVFR